MSNGTQRYLFAIAATAVPVVLAGAVYLATRDMDVEPPAPVPEQVAVLPSAPELIEARCASCHEPDGDGGHYRINSMRKTPEGWDMTLARMTIWHRVQIDPDERRVMVKYLADRQGLAPEETAPYRYALEQDYNREEDIADEDIGLYCARCHSFARVALQRRDEDEWRKLSHTHMGQYPNMDNQEKARSVEQYWQTMRDKIPVRLDVLYPFTTDAWTRWSAADKPSAAGSWRISGEWPGSGRYTGGAEITATGNDEYTATYTIDGADGSHTTGEGVGIVYTGYEWRGASSFEKFDIREVFALSADGDSMTGRWFLAEADELGASFNAVRMTEGGTRIVAVEPPRLRAGEETQVSIHGFGLSGEASLGAGVEIVETISLGAETVTVIARVAVDAGTGFRDVGVGGASGQGLFAVYRDIDSIRVEPPLALARVGGGGGPIPKVKAQFRAVAYLNGADGEPGTADDISLGSMPAAWSVENYDDVAESDHDADFAGSIDDKGLFTPGDAGINPARAEFSQPTNNAGNLSVVATIIDGERTITGKAHLIVTVQRWVKPPIR